MEFQITKLSDRTFSVQLVVGQERIATQIIVDLPGPPEQRPEQRQKEIAVAHAKKLAQGLLDAIDQWEKA